MRGCRGGRRRGGAPPGGYPRRLIAPLALRALHLFHRALLLELRFERGLGGDAAEGDGGPRRVGIPRLRRMPRGADVGGRRRTARAR